VIERLFPSFPSGQRGIALLLLRVFVGIAFLFHGYGKVVDVAGFAAEFGMPYLIAAAAACVQFGAGLLLILGLVTPLAKLASLALAGTMAVATSQLIARGEPFVSPHGHSWEASSFYLVLNVALILLGPGLYSTDWLLFGDDSGLLFLIQPIEDYALYGHFCVLSHSRKKSAPLSPARERGRGVRGIPVGLSQFPKARAV